MSEARQVGNVQGLIAKHLIYTFDNGWRYEIYVKNAHSFSYRIHSGIVAGRWVTDQEAFILDVGEHTYKISWDEPTGTTVSLVVNLAQRREMRAFGGSGKISAPRNDEDGSKRSLGVFRMSDPVPADENESEEAVAGSRR